MDSFNFRPYFNALRHALPWMGLALLAGAAISLAISFITPTPPQTYTAYEMSLQAAGTYKGQPADVATPAKTSLPRTMQTILAGAAGILVVAFLAILRTWWGRLTVPEIPSMNSLPIKHFPIELLYLAGGVSAGLAIALLPAWRMALALALVVVCVAALITAAGPVSVRFAVALGLLASADFAKRLVFLETGQSAWSQYLLFLLPFLYFFITLLIPWLLSLSVRRLSAGQWAIIAFTTLLLLNTWLTNESNLKAKAAASALLVLPWLMAAVAAEYPKSLPLAARTLVGLGLVSALYGSWQFFFGPTAIDLNWTGASDEISIGADQIIAFLTNRYGIINVFRPSGWQGDAFTFGLFCYTAFIFAWLLYEQQLLRKRSFSLVAIILLAGVLICMVRTIWVGIAGTILYALLARRWPILLRPGVVIALMICGFFAANLATNLLYPFMWLASIIKNPLVARVLMFGTLADRVRSVEAFWQALPHLLVSGYGAAASSWITYKFGGMAILPRNYAEHNVVVEQLYYSGLPGLALFFSIIYLALRQSWQKMQCGVWTQGLAAVFAALLLGLYLTGLGNGGVFLNLYFFFILGLMLAKQNNLRSNSSV